MVTCYGNLGLMTCITVSLLGPVEAHQVYAIFINMSKISKNTSLVS